MGQPEKHNVSGSCGAVKYVELGLGGRLVTKTRAGDGTMDRIVAKKTEHGYDRGEGCHYRGAAGHSQKETGYFFL
jgi:hypothetical protein